MTRPPAPPEVLQIMYCKCQTGCNTERCGSKRNGLKCTDLCQCKSCGNSSIDVETESRWQQWWRLITWVNICQIINLLIFGCGFVWSYAFQEVWFWCWNVVLDTCWRNYCLQSNMVKWRDCKRILSTWEKLPMLISFASIADATMVWKMNLERYNLEHCMLWKTTWTKYRYLYIWYVLLVNK